MILTPCSIFRAFIKIACLNICIFVSYPLVAQISSQSTDKTIEEEIEESMQRADRSALESPDDEQDDIDVSSLDLIARDDEPDIQRSNADDDQAAVRERYINEIIVEGNKHVPLEPILNRIPYHIGELFSPQKTNKLIRNVWDLGYFRKIDVYTQDVGDDKLNLIVSVDEKRLLEEVRFYGNKHLSETEIKKKIDFSRVPAVDEDDIPRYVRIIKKLYREKDYHDVTIKAELKGDEEKAILIFTISEGQRTFVKQVCFTGNDHFRAKKLRTLLFTREDWILGFLDRAGSFQPDAIEADKFVLENFYQSNGFLNAKVYDVSVDMDEKTQGLAVTFHIDEGDLYTVSDVRVPGNDIVSEAELLPRLPVQAGQLFSKEKIRETLEALRVLWGSYGYINADIEPSIQPNDNDKTVSVAFYTELGTKVFVNKITIIGNEKTLDKVIRRQLLGLVEEGCMLTSHALDEAKNRVEGLGYFDQRDGVNWRIHRVGKDKVDLDLIVKEVKTGRAEAQIGFGGSVKDISSPTESFQIGASVRETNLFGRGIHINSSVSYSKEERNLFFNITNPWLFDKPIHSAFDLVLKRSLYDEFKLIEQSEIKERITGGSGTLGIISEKIFDATLSCKVGVDGITYNETPIVKRTLPPLEARELQAVWDRRFASGAFLWAAGYAFKDVRNHPIHPSRGYKWSLETKVSIHSNLKDNPLDNPLEILRLEEGRGRFGYAKVDFDASWYTPLIGERDLVLCLHGYVGLVTPFPGRSIPFRELYHVGGPTSIRGFLYGEIGPMYFSPQLNEQDMLGAKKALWVNAELIFPITSDFSMKGAVFYDGGTGWDTPDANLITPAHLRNNTFNYRHSVGIGLRILRPTPVKIDWGFKLDRKKGETSNQVHFSMYHDF